MLYLNVHQTSDAGKVEGDFSNSYTYVDLMVKKIPLKKTNKKKKKKKFRWKRVHHLFLKICNTHLNAASCSFVLLLYQACKPHMHDSSSLGLVDPDTVLVNLNPQRIIYAFEDVSNEPQC